ncbi:hypothetical protein CEXT_769681 [Caerostris extrusa]|uniref:Uncharacterized protein n=1 Tax=Caerostris extrusa TaxID=172846 RepID=A0AAV4N105_CAEEX|nr:hypothetical protein CEXT_769681 [Caerostris extrusa]
MRLICIPKDSSGCRFVLVYHCQFLQFASHEVKTLAIRTLLVMHFFSFLIFDIRTKPKNASKRKIDGWKNLENGTLRTREGLC